jgi:hypothetical protein
VTQDSSLEILCRKLFDYPCLFLKKFKSFNFQHKKYKM